MKATAPWGGRYVGSDDGQPEPYRGKIRYIFSKNGGSLKPVV